MGTCIFLVKRGVADRDSFVILILNSLRPLCLCELPIVEMSGLRGFSRRSARLQGYARRASLMPLTLRHGFVMVWVSSFLENQSQSIFEYAVVKLFHIDNVLSEGV